MSDAPDVPEIDEEVHHDEQNRPQNERNEGMLEYWQPSRGWFKYILFLRKKTGKTGFCMYCMNPAHQHEGQAPCSKSIQDSRLRPDDPSYTVRFLKRWAIAGCLSEVDTKTKH